MGIHYITTIYHGKQIGGWPTSRSGFCSTFKKKKKKVLSGGWCSWLNSALTKSFLTGNVEALDEITLSMHFGPRRTWKYVRTIAWLFTVDNRVWRFAPAAAFPQWNAALALARYVNVRPERAQGLFILGTFDMNALRAQRQSETFSCGPSSISSHSVDRIRKKEVKCRRTASAIKSLFTFAVEIARLILRSISLTRRDFIFSHGSLFGFFPRIYQLFLEISCPVLNSIELCAPSCMSNVIFSPRRFSSTSTEQSMPTMSLKCVSLSSPLQTGQANCVPFSTVNFQFFDLQRWEKLSLTRQMTSECFWEKKKTTEKTQTFGLWKASK